MFNEILSKLATMFLLTSFTLLQIHFFLFQFLRWKIAFFYPNLVSLHVPNVFNQISSKFVIMFLFAHFILQLIYFFLFQFLRWKTAFFESNIVSLPVWNMFNQFSSKFALMFLLSHFILNLIDPIFPAKILYLIFKVKHRIFRPKTYISSHSKHI